MILIMMIILKKQIPGGGFLKCLATTGGEEKKSETLNIVIRKFIFDFKKKNDHNFETTNRSTGFNDQTKFRKTKFIMNRHRFSFF